VIFKTGEENTTPLCPQPHTFPTRLSIIEKSCPGPEVGFWEITIESPQSPFLDRDGSWRCLAVEACCRDAYGSEVIVWKSTAPIASFGVQS